MPIKNIPIGQILIDSKLITSDQLNYALELQMITACFIKVQVVHIVTTPATKDVQLFTKF
jgi:hypothetical protein